MEDVVKRIEKMFGVVMVTGPRQVGKTTLLKQVADKAAYVTLDDPIMLQSAIYEPGTLFKNTPPPVFVDNLVFADIFWVLFQ